jgi:cell division inhibitor SepF
MSTLHKVKAYFGMAPMDDYDDEYYDDRAPSRGFPRPRFDDGYGPYEGRDYDDPRGEPDYPPSGYRGGYGDEPRYGPVHPRDFERSEMSRPRLGSWLRNSTRGALAMDPRRMAMMFEEGHPLSKITTLRPKDYSEARTIGERFRDGTPVIMDLVSMDNADAKRLVDFAAGLAFALRGSFDKVATKVFLLSPADVDVTPEERRRIAETGFYACQ